MSFLDHIDKKSFENLMNSEGFKKWLYSKRWFGDKSILSNLDFHISIDYFKLITKNILILIIKILKSDYKETYFLPLLYFSELNQNIRKTENYKDEIIDFENNFLNIPISFIENDEKKEINLNIIEAEYCLYFWKYLLFKKDFYGDSNSHLLKFKFFNLKSQNNKKITQILNSLKNKDNYKCFNFKIEQLGGGNTTNLLIKFTFINREEDQKDYHSFVLKSYKKFSEKLEPMTLNILAKNNFLYVPKIYATIKLDNKDLISIIEYIPNKGSIGEIYWNELNHMIKDLFKISNRESINYYQDEKKILNIIKKYCRTSIKISKNIKIFIQNFHRAIINEKNEYYSTKIIEADYYLRNYIHKLILVVLDIEYVIKQDPKELLINTPEINSLLNKIKDNLLKIVSNINNNEIKLQPIHQDLHMEQILYDKTKKNFVFYLIDLEGNPEFSFEEKKNKFPIERDIASFLRSFSYIKFNSFLQFIIKEYFSEKNKKYSIRFLYNFFFNKMKKNGKDNLEKLLLLLNKWENIFINKFLKSLVTNSTLVYIFLIDRILHEILYEIHFRPDNVIIPFLGLKEIVNCLGEKKNLDD